MILFYDTETTGLPLFQEPSEHPGQPHIVQLAALLTDDAGKKLASLDVIIQPDGWDMTPKALETHGITIEQAAAVGVPAGEAINVFLSLWRRANVRVGFNESFDARLVRIALCRAYGKSDVINPEWKKGAAEDVMATAKPICQMPPSDRMMAAGNNGFKPPKLTEAYSIIMGEPMRNAHDAMGDVIATRALYYKTKEMAVAP